MAIPFSRSLRALEADTFVGRRWLFLGLGLLLTWLLWFFVARVGVYESSSRARVESSLTVHRVESPVTAMVIRSRLQLGQPVKTGEILIELDAAPERTQLEETLGTIQQLETQLAQVQVEIAEAEATIPEIRETQRLELEQIAAEIDEAKAMHAFAEKHLERVGRLHDSRLAAAEEVDEARAEVEAGVARIQRLEAAKARRLGEHRVELRERDQRLRRRRLAALELQGRRDALSSQARRYRLRIEERTVRSPVDGRLGEITELEAGSVLEAGDAICSVVPDEGTQRIVAGFPAHRILGRMHEGQSASVRLDGFPWPEYGLLPARVESIGSDSELDDDGLLRVELSLRTDRLSAEPSELTHPALEHGLPGEVRVLVESVSPATLLLRTLGRATGRTFGGRPGPRGSAAHGGARS